MSNISAITKLASTYLRRSIIRNARYLADIMMSFKTMSERFIKIKPDINKIIKRIDDVLYREADKLEDDQFCENLAKELELVYFKLRDL